jgi:hypothetical protein
MEAAEKGGLSMIYEARNGKAIHLTLAVATGLLSILGLAIAGVIPTNSGSYPATGWGIVVVCVLVAIYFVYIALDDTVQARLDQHGIYARRGAKETVPWDDIAEVSLLRVGIQRLATFRRKSGGKFGINATFYDKRMGKLIAALHHYRPDLAP